MNELTDQQISKILGSSAHSVARQMDSVTSGNWGAIVIISDDKGQVSCGAFGLDMEAVRSVLRVCAAGPTDSTYISNTEEFDGPKQ